MAKYKVEFSATAEKQLQRLPGQAQRTIAKATLNLANEPFPRGARKLRGYNDVYRIRVGVYRILYSVENDKLIIIILKIGHRKDVYR